MHRRRSSAWPHSKIILYHQLRQFIAWSMSAFSLWWARSGSDNASALGHWCSHSWILSLLVVHSFANALALINLHSSLSGNCLYLVILCKLHFIMNNLTWCRCCEIYLCLLDLLAMSAKTTTPYHSDESVPVLISSIKFELE